MELLRARAPNAAGIRLHGTEVQAHAGEDGVIGVVHGVVAALQAGLVEMEAVGVLHQKLAGTHDTEARSHLVAELQLDLVKVDGQLLVAAQFAPSEVRDDFLVGRAVDEFALMAVLEAQQFGTKLPPPAAFLPQFGRLRGRHQHLQSASAIHFFPDDVFDLPQYLQAHRQPGVLAGGEAADEPRAEHELVGNDLRFGRHFLEVGNGVGGKAHGQESRQQTRIRSV